MCPVNKIEAQKIGRQEKYIGGGGGHMSLRKRATLRYTVV